MTEDRLIDYIAELQSIAQAGLWYGKDKFDKERYARLREIAAEMLAMKTDLPLAKVKDLFCGDTGYQTPKVETRAAIVKEGKILLVRESDDLWALPGGWCDYDLSPVDNTVKEAWEEAGRNIKVRSLIAVQDREKHNEPRYLYKIVKLFYLCEELGGAFTENMETTAAEYFAENELPPLAEEKVTAEQIRMCLAAARAEYWQAQFD